MSFLDELKQTVKTEEISQENSLQNQENITSENQETQENISADSETIIETDTETKTEYDNGNVNAADTPVQDIKTENPVKKIFATEEIAEANAYLLKNPDKNYSDYMALKVPPDQLKSEDLIRKYLSEKEGYTESKIALELKKLELKNEEGDFDDDFSEDKDSIEYLEKKARYEELDRNARAWYDGYVKEQLTFDVETENNTENSEENQNKVKSIDEFLAEAQKAQQEYTQNYRTEIYKAVGEINEIPLKINGKEILFVPDDEFKTNMRKSAEDVAGIGKEYFDENGSVTNAHSFIKENTLWADPKTRLPMIDFMIKQAILEDRASRDKGQRNITLGDREPHSVEGAKTDKVAEILASRKKGTF